MSYQAHHLSPKSSLTRPPLLLNPHASSTTPSNTNASPTQTTAPNPSIAAFHKTFPEYAPTPLHSLPSLATDLGLRAVYLKDEATRCGLPSFKILGASWAIFLAVASATDYAPPAPGPELAALTAHLEKLRAAGDETVKGLSLVTCTEGNWGRATARVARFLGLRATVYVPGFMSEGTRGLIRGEGADVRVLENGSYDDAIAAARGHAANDKGALLLMDVAWEGYEEIPGWVTEGYSTMLSETDAQLAQLSPGTTPSLAIASVGVGSWAHAVATHYTSRSTSTPSSTPQTKLLTTEPTTAASLKESLHTGTPTSLQTAHTIMAGLNCGTVSSLAWPILRDSVWIACAVSEAEAHVAVQAVRRAGVGAGPCGAATVVGLRKVCEAADAAEDAVGRAARSVLGVRGSEERAGKVVVLFSTEGTREYEVPG